MPLFWWVSIFLVVFIVILLIEMYFYFSFYLFLKKEVMSEMKKYLW